MRCRFLPSRLVVPLIGGLLLSSAPALHAQDRAGAKPDPARLREAHATIANVERLTTAFRLLEYGKGEDTKGEVRGGAPDMLFAATRILREVPPVTPLKAEIEVQGPGAKPGGGALKALSLKEEADEIVARTRKIIEGYSAARKAAYEVVLKDLEEVKPRDTQYAPRGLTQELAVGQTLKVQFRADPQLPMMIAFYATGPCQVEITHQAAGKPKEAVSQANAVVTIGQITFIPGERNQVAITIQNPTRSKRSVRCYLLAN